jgi:Secretion system C-terminal sorting domain
LVSTNSKLTLYNAANGTRLSQLRGIDGVRGTAWINDTLVCAAFGYGTPTGASTIRFYSVKPNAIREVRTYPGLTTLADYPIVVGGDVIVGLLGSFLDTTASLVRVNTGLLTVAPIIIPLGTRGVGYQKPISIFGKILSINTGPYGSDTANLMTLFFQNSNAPSFQHLDIGITKTIGTDESSLIVHSNTGRAGIYKYNFNFPSLGAIIFPITDIAGGAYDSSSNEYFVASANFSGNSKLYQIRANTGSVDSINIGTSPEQIAVWSDNYLSVAEKTAKSHFNIYPNPAQNEVKINATNFSPKTVNLVSAHGITIQLPVINDIINLQGISSGVYTVIIPNSSFAAQRLVIQ